MGGDPERDAVYEYGHGETGKRPHQTGGSMETNTTDLSKPSACLFSHDQRHLGALVVTRI